jgi:hypothetical protein
VLIISKPGSTRYPNKFYLGDIAIAKTNVDFCDGTSHKVGQKIVVTEETKHYYNVCHEQYDKVNGSTN